MVNELVVDDVCSARENWEHHADKHDYQLHSNLSFLMTDVSIFYDPNFHQVRDYYVFDILRLGTPLI